MTSQIAVAVRRHAERYATGDPADTADYTTLTRAAMILDRDADEEQPTSSIPIEPT